MEHLLNAEKPFRVFLVSLCLLAFAAAGFDIQLPASFIIVSLLYNTKQDRNGFIADDICCNRTLQTIIESTGGQETTVILISPCTTTAEEKTASLCHTSLGEHHKNAPRTYHPTTRMRLWYSNLM